MLRRLVVQNLVLIREADLDLGPGLTVLTGETGAGKTVLAGALGLVLGAAGEARLVGPHAAEAYVEAAFDVPDDLADEAFDGVRDLLPDDEEDLVLARRIGPDGRGRALVGGRGAPRSALEAAGERLVGVVSQHEARRLGRPAVQRELLDAYAGEQQVPRLRAMAEAWKALADARRARRAAEAEAADADRVVADLEDVASRVRAAAPAPDEDAALLAERERLRNADALAQAAGGAAHLLLPEDGDGAVALAGAAERALRDGEAHDPALAALGDDLRDAVERLAAAARELRAYADGVEHDPARLDAVEERLARLEDLVRRHGSLAEALAAADRAEERLAELGEGDARLAALAAREAAALVAAEDAARALRAAREAAALPFAEAIAGHLADLGMPDARVRVEVRARDLGATGADAVELLVAPNPGLPLAPAGRPASGGELSRIALAIRVAAHEREAAATLVFDEVDAGVGGRTARAVGEKLKALSRSTQVICITHLPQIAALADRHLRVVKEPGDPTQTRIEPLLGDEVDAELARMLGAEEGSDEALRLARALRAGDA